LGLGTEPVILGTIPKMFAVEYCISDLMDCCN